MGYYTYLTLDLHGSSHDVAKVKRDLIEQNDVYEELVKEGCMETKSYDIDNDFVPVAKKNPNVLIILTGDGEESCDCWEWRGKGELEEFHHMEMPKFTTPELQINDN